MRKAITSVVMVCLILASVLAIGGVTAQPSEKVPVIVGFKDKPDANLIREHGGEIKYVYNLVPAVACSLPQQAIDSLKKNPVIAYIEADFEVYAIDTELDNSWGVKRIGAGVVHGYNKGKGVNVAIIDTGIDYTHPDLDANYKGGYDFVNFDGDPKDDHGHGTHCAGIVAAEDNDNGVIGVAPEAYLYAVKVLNKYGSGYLSSVILGIQWSVDNYMQVVSMSLGTSTYSQSLKDACDNAYKALVLVAAAGNSGDGNPATNEYSYPAAYASVIAVGATDKTDTAPSWSNSGPYLELAAPGVSIYSTLPTYKVTMTANYGLNYGTASGTSMACPHVAGTAALVIASNPTLKNVDVRTRLQTTAGDLGPIEWDTVYGHGLVDANEAASGTDTTMPAISAVASSDITTSTARITWTTNEPSDSTVNYGTTTTPGTKVYDATMVTSHSITLTGLAPGTTYYYEVRSTDSAGNTAVDNGGSYYTFTTLTPDTTPPSTTNLTATAGAYPNIHLAWTAATDNVGVDHYNIYRNTTGTIDTATDFLATAAGTVTSYTDSTGMAETTYYYAVCAVDAAGNEAGLSNIASATVAPAPSNTMHVASIVMSLKTVGINTNAIATVTVVAADDITPVVGATVYGHWEIATMDSDSGITNASGQVSLQSDKVKRAASGTTFKFVVDRVELSGWTYNSSANVETSDSITV